MKPSDNILCDTIKPKQMYRCRILNKHQIFHINNYARCKQRAFLGYLPF